MMPFQTNIGRCPKYYDSINLRNVKTYKALMQVLTLGDASLSNIEFESLTCCSYATYFIIFLWYNQRLQVKNSHFKIIPDTTTFAWKQKKYRQD